MKTIASKAPIPPMKKSQYSCLLRGVEESVEDFGGEGCGGGVFEVGDGDGNGGGVSIPRWGKSSFRCVGAPLGRGARGSFGIGGGNSKFI